jgi:hypothetical protein
MKRLLVPVLLTLGLIGCASSPDLPAGYALDPGRPEGLAIVSLTLTGKQLNRISVFEYRLREIPPRGGMFADTRDHYDSPRQHARSVQAVGENPPGSRSVVIKGVNSAEPLDIGDAGQAQGRLATVRLPAGEYELHSWRLREPTPYGEREYKPPQEFSYRFSVKPGEMTYLGRVNLHLGERNAVRISVEDRRQDDLALLGRKHPALATGKITHAVGSL